jgi:hypothetical protein
VPRISPFGSQPQLGTASPQQRRDAAERYTDCLTRNARRLDDRVSDASTIAMAIQPSCTAEFDSWKLVLQQGETAEARVALDRALDAGSQSAAVQAVLQVRQAASLSRR